MPAFSKREGADALVREGLELLRAGKAKEAAAKLTQATEADPAHAEGWYYLGTLYGEAHQPEAAIDCYRKSARHAPPGRQALPLYNLGNVLQATGKLHEALEVFTLATKADPKMADAWINRGRLLDDGGGHAEAIECYETALALAPQDVCALANRGNSLRSLHRFAEAKSSYEAALAVDPGDGASLVGLGQCLYNLGQPEQALRVTDMALKQYRNPAVWSERALILATLKRHDEALASIDEAIRQGLRNEQVYNNRAEVLATLQRVNESIASFDEALKLNPAYAPALFGKARVLCRAKMFGPAVAAIKLYFEHSDGSDGLREAANAVVALCRSAGMPT